MGDLRVYDPATIAEMLGTALDAPDLGVKAERDGTSVYLYLPDGGILRCDVAWVARARQRG